MFDLHPAASELTRLVSGVGDDQLDAPTPCTDWSVRDLLAHIHQFASVFTTNAGKQPPAPPDGLVDDWRTAIPATLGDLAEAWQDPVAWEGRVSAGGVEMSAPDNAVVGVEELTVHGWDLARATGQPFEPGEDAVGHVERFLTMFGAGERPFDSPLAPPPDATRWESALAEAGRDPRWRP